MICTRPQNVYYWRCDTYERNGREAPFLFHNLVQSDHCTIIKRERERGVFHFSIINILLLLSATLWIYGIEGNAKFDVEFLNKTQSLMFE